MRYHPLISRRDFFDRRYRLNALRRALGCRLEEVRGGRDHLFRHVARTEKYVYILEFKLNRSAAEALKQIHSKEYYQKYLGSGREVILVGAKFSTKKHNIADWKTEVIKEFMPVSPCQ